MKNADNPNSETDGNAAVSEEVTKISELRKQFQADPTEENFGRLLKEAKLGDHIWYAWKQPVFKMSRVRSPYSNLEYINCFGTFCELDSISPTIVGESPKVFRPTKLILAGKFTSEGSWRRQYVFTEPGQDYYPGNKWVWSPSVWNDIQHPGSGLYRDHTIDFRDLQEQGKRVFSLNLEMSRPRRTLVFVDEDACAAMCKRLNKECFAQSDREIAKTLRSMQRQFKAYLNEQKEP